MVGTLHLLIARRLIHLVSVAQALAVLLDEFLLLLGLLERLQIGRDVERLAAALFLLSQRNLMIEVIQQQLRIFENRLRVVRVKRRCRLRNTIRRILLRLNHGLIVGESRQLVIVVVPVELLLDLAVAQARRVILELRIVQVLPLFVDVVLIEVVFSGRNERSPQPSLIQGLPVEVAEPRVVLDLVRAIITQSILRLSLNHPIDEVGGLDAPSGRDVLHLDLDLLRHDVLADLFSALANVRAFTVHALVGHDADCEVINCLRVIEPEHDFRGHIAGRARGVRRVLRSPNSRNTKVRDAQVAIVVDDEVLWLDVSVQDLLLVAVLETGD